MVVGEGDKAYLGVLGEHWLEGGWQDCGVRGCEGGGWSLVLGGKGWQWQSLVVLLLSNDSFFVAGRFDS